MTTETMTGALGTVKEIVTWVITTVSENPVLVVFFVAGIIPCGIKVFRSLKNSVK